MCIDSTRLTMIPYDKFSGKKLPLSQMYNNFHTPHIRFEHDTMTTVKIIANYYNSLFKFLNAMNLWPNENPYWVSYVLNPRTTQWKYLKLYLYIICTMHIYTSFGAKRWGEKFKKCINKLHNYIIGIINYYALALKLVNVAFMVHACILISLFGPVLIQK